MNCEDVIEQLLEAVNPQDELENRKLTAHVENCDSCRDALRGANAMRVVKNRPAQRPPDGLFTRVMAEATKPVPKAPGRSQFWAGTAVGGFLAAGVAIAIVSFGFFETPTDSVVASPIITMALGDQQEISIAIDAERDLLNATVNVLLSGGIEIVGLGAQRELSWNTDLQKGVNKLTLPLTAVDLAEGHLIVRLEHEGTQRIFRVDLKIDT
ncbi:MAG: hypothetical protein ACI88G_002218 [Woeseiaceae bacterium]|jgi:hypothetical protein